MDANAPVRPDTADARRYAEPGRSYRTTLALFVLLAAGFGLDLALGGGVAHLIGWIVAVVLVVGADALVTHAARSLRSITVTATELRVGDDAIARADIAGVLSEPGDDVPVLGVGPGSGLPRGVAGLALRLADGRTVLVPSRHPDRLAAALEVAPDRAEVRLATAEDLPLLAEIDSRADTLFRVAGIDLPLIPFPEDALADAKAVFVAGHPPVGFVRVDEVDGLAHVEALAVVPGHMREGLGTALLEAACAWAKQHHYPAITLITFADVAWNGPFYAARGFVEVDEFTPEIAELRDWEHAMGLDAQRRRIVMRRPL
jgi:GNAT superfamily N-acetyltransferase